jgi:hypothetical protein
MRSILHEVNDGADFGQIAAALLALGHIDFE